jgi:hypothetical protein
MYAPEQVKADSLAIGVTHEYNNAPNMTENQYLAVGEFRRTDGRRAFNMIVDHEGVAIRTEFPDRTASRNEYALYVDGDVFVTGKVVASNMVEQTPGGAFVVLGDGGSGSGMGGDSFWSLASEGIAENLYYPGKVSIGNVFLARSNAYSLNISKVADCTIDHAQIAIQNTQDAQLRMGILGNASNSPAIFNTPPGTALEFHVGRDQSYFGARYVSTETRYDRDPFTGEMTPRLETLQANVPAYPTHEVAPHMIFDTSGHVGIRTSLVPPISFNMRQRTPGRPLEMRYFPTREPMALHVDGPLYGSNIVMWDYESGTHKHLDELYVRRLGVTIPANQIEPGPFGVGDYSFPGNLGVGGPVDPAYDLVVYGDGKITQDMNVGGTTFTQQLISTDAILLDVASFCNDIYVNRDMIVNQAIRLRGQIFVETLSVEEGEEGRSNFSWRAIEFAPAGASLSNLNVMGQGLSTPGRFGAGIDPSNDEVNHQLSVVKRDPGERLFNNMFELHLEDKTSGKYRKAAWIGHPAAHPTRINDGSLVIATPATNDTVYSGIFGSYPQNIYMFPGADMSPSAPLLLDESTVPTLGVFHNKRVGVLTYSPQVELDVKGSIAFTKDMFFIDEGRYLKLGLWKAREFVNIDPATNNPNLYRGIIYNDVAAPYVGIQAEPDTRYSVRIGGAVQADAFFNTNHRRLADWFDARHAPTNSNHTSPTSPYNLYTWGRTGVGVTNSTAMLAIQDNFQSAQGTRLQLMTGATDAKKATSIAFEGPFQTYVVQHDDVRRVWEVAHESHLDDPAAPRALWTRYNDALRNYQVVIGCNLNVLTAIAGNSNPDLDAALTVGGGMSVLGNVSITGEFRVQTRAVGINDTVPYQPPLLDRDDVYLGGNHIVLQPASGRTVAVGNLAAFSIGGLNDIAADSRSMLRVYQDVPNQPVATFRGSGNTALLEIAANGSGRRLKFGVVDTTGTDVPFAFLDENDQSFLSFLRPTNSTIEQHFVGFGVRRPTAMIHVQTTGFGSNMLRLTKDGPGATTSAACPQIELEKTMPLGRRPTRWTVSGPNAEYAEKLSFSYSDHESGSREVFTFTNNGCIGFNMPRPEFALDIRNTGRRGSLRLLNTDNGTAAPQIIFQSGAEEFGGDESFDFRMGASNDTFNFYMQNIDRTFPLFNVGSNAHVGIRCEPNPLYPVEMNGSLNVVGDNASIFINGTSIIDGSGTNEGTAFNSPNIYFMPNINFSGGVTINKNQPTCNLFYLYAGLNCNMMVLDSWHDESQMHFRIQDGNSSGRFNLWRAAARNSQFYWSFFPNCGNDLTVDPGSQGHIRALEMGASTAVGRTSEFDMTFYGQATLQSTLPTLHLGPHGRLGASNARVFLMSSCNVGVGTTTPAAAFHVLHPNADTRPVMTLEQQAGSADVLRVVQAGNRIVTVSASRNVGLGTTVPRGTLDVAVGQILAANGTVTAPSIAFSASPRTGMWSPASNQISIATDGQTRASILGDGSVRIGADVSRGLVTVSQDTLDQPLMAVHQTGGGEILHLSATINDNADALVVAADGFVGIGTASSESAARMQVQGTLAVHGNLVPTTAETYDLGRPGFRWRDLYLSGSTINLGGTTLSREPDGSVRIADVGDNLRNVVVDAVQIGDDTTPSKLIIRTNEAGIVQFVNTNVQTGESISYVPVLSDQTNDTINIGSSSKSAALAVRTLTNVTFALEQDGGALLAEYFSGGEQVGVMDNAGNIGIGTSLAPAALTVQSRGGDMAHLLPDSIHLGPTVIDRHGNIGIHTNAPLVALHVVGSNIVDGRSHFTSNVYMGANLEVWGNSLTHGNSVTDSDQRIKKDLVRIDHALDKVEALTGYTFTRTTDEQRSTGLIAQDVEKVLPEAVSHDGPFLGLMYGNMVGLLVEAIKELRGEIRNLSKRIDALP